MEGRCTRVYGDGVPCAAKGCKVLFEGSHVSALHVFSTAQNIKHDAVQLGSNRAVLGLEIEKRNHEALRAALISTGAPRCLRDCMAHSSIATTLSPLIPEVIGDEPVVTDLTKCSVSVRSASFTDNCGDHISPMR